LAATKPSTVTSRKKTMKTVIASQLAMNEFSLPGHIAFHERECSHASMHETDESLCSCKVDHRRDNGSNDHPQQLEPIEEWNTDKRWFPEVVEGWPH
jgi:hypothetical protein